MQEPRKRPRPERPVYESPDETTTEEFGTVKFYAGGKGFGFIHRESGGKDVFAHATALNRAGISDLAQGQRVAMAVVEGRKGSEVVSFRLMT